MAGERLQANTATIPPERRSLPEAGAMEMLDSPVVLVRDPVRVRALAHLAVAHHGRRLVDAREHARTITGRPAHCVAVHRGNHTVTYNLDAIKPSELHDALTHDTAWTDPTGHRINPNHIAD
jgi:hypothetical protein